MPSPPCVGDKPMNQTHLTCPNTESTMGNRSTGSSSFSLSFLCGPSMSSSNFSSSSWASSILEVCRGTWVAFLRRGGCVVGSSPLTLPCSLPLFFCFSTFFLMAAWTCGCGEGWLHQSHCTHRPSAVMSQNMVLSVPAYDTWPFKMHANEIQHLGLSR